MPAVAELSDDALYASFCTQQREAAFDELVRRFQHSAYRIAFARCGEPSVADEAVQEAFLRLAQRAYQHAQGAQIAPSEALALKLKRTHELVQANTGPR